MSVLYELVVISSKIHIFVLIFFNIFSYVCLNSLVFSLLLNLDYTRLNRLADLQYLGKDSIYTIILVVCFLAFSGIPPLLPFFMKLLTILFLLKFKVMCIFFIFFILNVFSIYFYLQNLRYIASKSAYTPLMHKQFFVYTNYTLSKLTALLCLPVLIPAPFLENSYILLLKFSLLSSLY